MKAVLDIKKKRHYFESVSTQDYEFRSLKSFKSRATGIIFLIKNLLILGHETDWSSCVLDIHIFGQEDFYKPLQCIRMQKFYPTAYVVSGDLIYILSYNGKGTTFLNKEDSKKQISIFKLTEDMSSPLQELKSITFQSDENPQLHKINNQVYVLKRLNLDEGDL